MVAVALAAMSAVILLTGGVVMGSDTPDTLAFYGVVVHTTSAQIFLTGAICTWVLLAAGWLLSTGLRRSRERGVQLAIIRAGPHGARAQAATELAGVSGCVEDGADWPGAGNGRDIGDAGRQTAEQETDGE